MKLLEVKQNEAIKRILVYIKDEKIISAWETLIQLENQGKISDELQTIRDWLMRETINDPKWAYAYAFNIINGRWPPGEKAIASDPDWYAAYQNFINEIT